MSILPRLRSLVASHAQRPGPLSIIRLFLKAQSVRSTPIDRVLASMAQMPIPSPISEQATIRRVVLCGRLFGALGMLNTCVSRSLVLGTLLRDKGEVEIIIGFKQSECAGPQGHAWVCVDGSPVTFSNDELEDLGNFTITATLKVQQ